MKQLPETSNGANNNSHKVEITTAAIVKGVVFVLVLWFLYLAREVLAIVFFSIVIASAIEPISGWFSKYRVPRVWGVIFIYLFGLAVLGLIFYLIVPTMVSEFGNFSSTFPDYLLQFSNIREFIPELPDSVSALLQGPAAELQGWAGRWAKDFLQATSAIFGGLFSFILIIIISFYLSVQERGIDRFIKIVAPASYENYILDLWQRSRRKLGGWLKGQLLLAVLVGVLVYLGLSILQIEYAFLLALLAALLEIIPMFGPVMAAIPAIFIALLQKPILGLMVLFLYVIVQQFENHLIYPLVVRKTIGVPPLIAILALLVGGKLGGFFGLLLAVPIATILMEISSDIEKKKRKTADS